LTENYLKNLDYSVLQQCIHCGMCLPTCPTYDSTLKETSSPRGRIALMRAVADGELETGDGFAKEMFFCLGCLACQSVCPAHVNYAEMIESARAETMRLHAGEGRRKIRRLLINFLFSSRKRIRTAARVLWAYQRSGLQSLVRRTGMPRLFGARAAELESMAPQIDSKFTPHGSFRPNTLVRRRVGLLAGCVQDVAFASVNRDTIEVLLENGCAVEVPETQQCCGSLQGHHGEIESARQRARENLDAFDVRGLDAIVVNSAGCGSFMKRYGSLLEHDSRYAGRAREWSAKVKDISEFLAEHGIRAPKRALGGRRITYHDACHLCHGQQIRLEPRQLLQSVPGVELVEMREPEWCCGSAGIYNLTHPAQATELLDRKMAHIAQTGAEMVAVGNPGCAIQLQHGARRGGLDISIEHPVSLLAQAYRKEAGAKRI
jgi:glycolate oxidase iron-sulfur subunit